MPSNVVHGENTALDNAACWLREYLGIPGSETIFEQFEEYFNCRLVVGDITDPWYCPDYAVFASAEDATMFLLKWGD